MMNRHFLVYILILTSPCTMAQHDQLHTIDSLEIALQNNPPDSNKVDIFNTIALIHYNNDLKKCLVNAHKALELANQESYDKGEEKALSILTRAHRRIGNFSVALEFNLRQITICDKLKDTLRLIDGYTSLGNIHL